MVITNVDDCRYVCARQCDVETLEETLHDNLYGMAMQEDDDNNYFELVNLATLELLNHGTYTANNYSCINIINYNEYIMQLNPTILKVT